MCMSIFGEFRTKHFLYVTNVGRLFLLRIYYFSNIIRTFLTESKSALPDPINISPTLRIKILIQSAIVLWNNSKLSNDHYNYSACC